VPSYVRRFGEYLRDLTVGFFLRVFQPLHLCNRHGFLHHIDAFFATKKSTDSYFSIKFRPQIVKVLYKFFVNRLAMRS